MIKIDCWNIKKVPNAFNLIPFFWPGIKTAPQGHVTPSAPVLNIISYFVRKEISLTNDFLW